MKLKLHWKNFLGILVAGIINAFGVVMFLQTGNLYDSGVSGLSMLLSNITIVTLLPVFLVGINIPLFLIGLKKRGLEFTIYSVFGVIIYSVSAYFVEKYIRIDLNDNTILYAIFGGLLSGLGSGLVIKFGGALDGMEVLGTIFAKKLNISIGTFVMIFNIVLYIVSGIITHNWILVLFSLLAYYINSKTLDFVVEGINRQKCAMIVTTKADDVTKAISTAFKSNGTIIDAVGGHEKESKNIIYFIINTFEINKLKETVYELDNKAFISLIEVSDVIKSK